MDNVGQTLLNLVTSIAILIIGYTLGRMAEKDDETNRRIDKIEQRIDRNIDCLDQRIDTLNNTIRLQINK